jgi:hypothetical protein
MGIELNKDECCCGKDCKIRCNIKFGSDKKEEKTVLERVSGILWILFFSALLFCSYTPAIVALFVLAVIFEGFD